MRFFLGFLVFLERFPVLELPPKSVGLFVDKMFAIRWTPYG
ncbi:hypothetical protein PCL1606_05210 [Pseudomonas chlororaphis]|uniref:Uncharacterized protein n=1 Tax=Pseudomonas chlororaphis TaxID=587753 RepID=A0A0D5XSA7_9PSED|nr:hypothetical protein PCL1606_05210 [Pseudomonas chlororaphis]